MKNLLISFTLIMVVSFQSFGQKTSDDRIESALLAAPEEKRENATVIALEADGKTIVLKKGSNEIICLADDPDKEGINVAAYHKDLEPFMESGRKLKAEGKGYKEIFKIRAEEAEKGKWKIPANTTLHIVMGDHYDSSSGKIVNEYRRWVIYIPYATGVTTGLPETPSAPGVPWLMDPGTYRAHIMISPAKN